MARKVIKFIYSKIKKPLNWTYKFGSVLKKFNNLQLGLQLFFPRVMQSVPTISSIAKTFIDSLRMTFSGYDTSQIKKAQQYVDIVSRDPSFKQVAIKILISLTQSQDQNIQKSFLLVIQRLIIECYSDTNAGDYFIESQRLLSIAFTSLNSKEIGFSIKTKIVKIVKLISQFFNTEMRNQIIEKIKRNYEDLEQLSSGNQAKLEAFIEQLQIVLLYGQIIVPNMGYSSVSFAFAKNILQVFSHTLYLLVDQISKNQKIHININRNQDIPQMTLLNINILCSLLKKCDIFQQKDLFNWIVSEQSAYLIKCLENLPDQFCSIINCKFKFYQVVLEFFSKYKLNNSQEYLKQHIFEEFSSQILPKTLKSCIKLIQDQITPDITQLHNSLKLLNLSLNFHIFYEFFTENLRTLIGSVVVPIITSEAASQNLRVEDYLNFSDFLSEKQTITNYSSQRRDPQAIHKNICKKNRTILPYEILELDNQEQEQRVISKNIKLKQKVQFQEKSTVFQCQEVSVEILKRCLKKIDTFSPIFYKELDNQIEKLKNSQQTDWNYATLLLLSIVAKSHDGENNQILVKMHGMTQTVLKMFEIHTQSYNHSQKRPQLNFKQLVLTLCFIQTYLKQLNLDLQLKQQNLRQIKSLCYNICVFIQNTIESMSLNQRLQQKIVVSLLAMNVLKQIIIESEIQQSLTGIYTVFGNILSQVQVNQEQQESISNNTAPLTLKLQDFQGQDLLTFMGSLFDILDQIIQLLSLSFDHHKSFVIQSIVYSCRKLIVKLYEASNLVESRCSIILLWAWNTLVGVISHRFLFQKMQGEFKNFIYKILDIFKKNPKLKQNIWQRSPLSCEYIVILAASLIKNQKIIVPFDVYHTTLQLFFNHKNAEIDLAPFGNQFQLFQRMIFLSLCDDDDIKVERKMRKESEKIIEERQQKQQQGKLIGINSLQFQKLNKFDIIYRVSIADLSQCNTNMKHLESIITFQNILLKYPKYLTSNIPNQKLTEILQITEFYLTKPNFYKEESNWPFIQNCFSLYLLILKNLKNQNQEYMLSKIMEMNNRRQSVKVNFKHCVVLDILTLGQIVEKKISLCISNKIYQFLRNLKNQWQALPAYQQNDFRFDFTKTFDSDDLQQMNEIYFLFNLLMDCLQEYFSLTKNQKLLSYDASSSNEIITNFRLVEPQIVNRFSKIDVLQTLKQNLQGKNMKGEQQKSVLQEIILLQFEDTLPQLLYDSQVADDLPQLTQRYAQDFDRMIDLCIQQTDLKRRFTIKSILRSQKVKNGHREIFKVKI